MANFGRFIYRDYLPEPGPARTTVRSDLPGFEIEIDAVVALASSQTLGGRRTERSVA